MDSILSDFHNAADLIATAVFALLCLKLMVVVERSLNQKHVQKGSLRSGTRVSIQSMSNFSTRTIKTVPCTSDPSAGDVLRIHFGYYRGTFGTSVGDSAEEMENAALFGMDNLEALKPAIKTALGDNLNSWSVDIFVERLAFFCHIKCRDCLPKDMKTDDDMKPVLALTNMEFSSGNGKSPFCRRHIFKAIHDKLQDDFIVYDAGDLISKAK